MRSQALFRPPQAMVRPGACLGAYVKTQSGLTRRIAGNMGPPTTSLCNAHCNINSNEISKLRHTPMEGSLGFPFPSCHVPRFTRGICTPGAISTVGVAPMANITTPITEDAIATHCLQCSATDSTHARTNAAEKQSETEKSIEICTPTSHDMVDSVAHNAGGGPAVPPRRVIRWLQSLQVSSIQTPFKPYAAVC